MKVAYLAFRPCENHQPSPENFGRVGSNTGNLVFDASLRTTIRCTPLLLEELKERSWEFDALVVRNFIWMSEGKDMSSFREIMDWFGKKPIIPHQCRTPIPGFPAGLSSAPGNRQNFAGAFRAVLYWRKRRVYRPDFGKTRRPKPADYRLPFPLLPSQF